ncbi:MAG: cob(I)yrinic acid a,c-diamide adenosyltransferase [Chloroflexi bacterium]|nr:cob(I)yrinic acid a,c-diamide adenosyltransferase [Chloroflexota bacterium]
MAELTSKGLVIVNTGNGKGKTTAALGLLLRASGWEKRTCMLQFIKNQGASGGEIKIARKLGLEIIPCGDGFTWQSRDLDQSAALARAAWQDAQQRILSGEYDLIILDEFTYTLVLGWLNTNDVLGWLRANKPANLHLVITGRDAPADLIAYADLVTEMREIKHPYNSGLPAQKGIEY